LKQGCGAGSPKERKDIFMQAIAAGMLAGFLNGLLGAGGGILAVALLSRSGLARKEAHATALALMLPLTVISLVVYQLHGNLPLKQVWPFLFPALLGALAGAWLLKKTPLLWVRLLFGLLVLYSAVRMLLQ